MFRFHYRSRIRVREHSNDTCNDDDDDDDDEETGEPDRLSRVARIKVTWSRRRQEFSVEEDFSVLYTRLDADQGGLDSDDETGRTHRTIDIVNAAECGLVDVYMIQNDAWERIFSVDSDFTRECRCCVGETVELRERGGGLPRPRWARFQVMETSRRQEFKLEKDFTVRYKALDPDSEGKNKKRNETRQECAP